MLVFLVAFLKFTLRLKGPHFYLNILSTVTGTSSIIHRHLLRRRGAYLSAPLSFLTLHNFTKLRGLGSFEREKNSLVIALSQIYDATTLWYVNKYPRFLKYGTPETFVHSLRVALHKIRIITRSKFIMTVSDKFNEKNKTIMFYK